MDAGEIRRGEGIGQEGLEQMEGLFATEGPGLAGAPAAPASAAPKKLRREARPSMRSAVVWSEILGKPKALRGKR